MYQFICDKESEPFRQKLDLCRQVRNLITHTAKTDGKAPVEPADDLIQALENTLSYLRKPPLAAEHATPADKLFVASLSDRMVWLMRKMEQKGFSHVPVADGKRLKGIFSMSTLFTLIMNGESNHLDDQTRMNDILDDIAPDKHSAERFLFLPPNATAFQAEEAFTKRNAPHEKRVAAIFITSDGTPGSELIGMLTPWDLMG